MPESYFFTTDADSWWLRFRLADYEEDHMEARTTEATIYTRPLGDYRNGAGDTQSFSVTTKASGGIQGWNDGGKAHYDSAAGVVDVSLSALTFRLDIGERLFIRLMANADAEENLIARAELVITQDKNREQESPSAATACEGDEYLSFRMADGNGIENAYIGPRLMSYGATGLYQLYIRPSGASLWSDSQFTYYDPLTGLIDVSIASILATAEPESTFDYKVTPHGSEVAIVQGVLTYSPECDQEESLPAPTSRYDLTANEISRDLRFRLTNFDPDPSQAVVTSVSIGRAPEPITSGEGVFYLRYRIDQSQLWRQKKTFFDDDAGVVEVNVRSILDAAQSSVEYRLVYRG